jgi:hypothetical protein
MAARRAGGRVALDPPRRVETLELRAGAEGIVGLTPALTALRVGGDAAPLVAADAERL